MELLAENIGQPGFRELLLTVHDLDGRRDLLFAIVAESRRAALVSKGNEERRSGVFDLAGLAVSGRIMQEDVPCISLHRLT